MIKKKNVEKKNTQTVEAYVTKVVDGINTRLDGIQKRINSMDVVNKRVSNLERDNQQLFKIINQQQDCLDRLVQESTIRKNKTTTSSQDQRGDHWIPWKKYTKTKKTKKGNWRRTDLSINTQKD